MPAHESSPADGADPAALAAARALRARIDDAGRGAVPARPSAARPGEAVVVVGAVGRGGAAVLAAAFGAWLARRLPAADLVQAAGWPGGQGWDVAAAAERIAAGGPLGAVGAVGALVALGDGGLARGARRVADASRVAVHIDAGAVPLHAGTARLCDALDINPLDLQSSGSLLLTAPDGGAASAVASLTAAGYDAAVVGRVVALGTDGAPEAPAVVLVMGGTRRVIQGGLDGVELVPAAGASRGGSGG